MLAEASAPSPARAAAMRSKSVAIPSLHSNSDQLATRSASVAEPSSASAPSSVPRAFDAESMAQAIQEVKDRGPSPHDHGKTSYTTHPPVTATTETGSQISSLASETAITPSGNTSVVSGSVIAEKQTAATSEQSQRPKPKVPDISKAKATSPCLDLEIIEVRKVPGSRDRLTQDKGTVSTPQQKKASQQTERASSPQPEITGARKVEKTLPSYGGEPVVFAPSARNARAPSRMRPSHSMVLAPTTQAAQRTNLPSPAASRSRESVRVQNGGMAGPELGTRRRMHPHVSGQGFGAAAPSPYAQRVQTGYDNVQMTPRSISGPILSAQTHPSQDSHSNKRVKMDPVSSTPQQSDFSGSKALWSVPEFEAKRQPYEKDASSYTSSFGPAAVKSEPVLGRSRMSTPGKPWTARGWSSSQYAYLAQYCEDSFPYDQFMNDFNKSAKEVQEVFASVIQRPLLSRSGRGPGAARGGLGEELVKDRRKQMRELSKEHKALHKLEQEDREIERNEMRRELEAEIWAKVERDGWVRLEQAKAILADKEKELGREAKLRGDDPPKNVAPSPVGPTPRGRKTTKVKTIDEAIKDVQDANSQLIKSQRAEKAKEERKRKRDDNKTGSLGNKFP